MVQTEETPQVTTLQLINKCDRCGAPGGLHSGSHNDYYCAKCLPQYVLYEHGGDHLKDLLKPVFTAWARHYQAAGLSTLAVRELIGFCIDDIVEEFISELFPD